MALPVPCGVTRRIMTSLIVKIYASCLDVGRVKHDAHAGAKRLRGKVVAEAAADDTADTVGAADLAPDDTELGAVLGGLGAVDVRHLLAQVPGKRNLKTYSNKT